jgi:hypothetical protein
MHAYKLAGLRRFLNKILAETRQKQLYNDFLQLECTPDGSAVTDILVKEEREIFARRICNTRHFSIAIILEWAASFLTPTSSPVLCTLVSVAVQLEKI